MFCPECGAEFREEIEKCADCEVTLVEEPPEEPKVPKYVTVLETSELSAIPVLKTVLESAFANFSPSIPLPVTLEIFRNGNSRSAARRSTA